MSNRSIVVLRLEWTGAFGQATQITSFDLICVTRGSHSGTGDSGAAFWHSSERAGVAERARSQFSARDDGPEIRVEGRESEREAGGARGAERRPESSRGAGLVLSARDSESCG